MGKSEETVRSLVEDPAVQAVELKVTARESPGWCSARGSSGTAPTTPP
jgi:hypothetical protein